MRRFASLWKFSYKSPVKSHGSHLKRLSIRLRGVTPHGGLKSHRYFHTTHYYSDIFPSYANTIIDDNIEKLCKKGEILEQRGDIHGAIKVYTEAIENSSSVRFRAFSLRGDAYQKVGEYDKAISDYTRILSLQTGHIPTFTAIANCHKLKGEYDLAERYFEKITQIEPNNLAGYLGRAESFFYLGRVDESKQCYDEAEKRFPNHKDRYLSLLRTQLASLDIGNALESANAVTELDPTDISGWCSKGICLYMLGKFNYAHEAFSQALDLGGPNEDIYIKRASCYFAQGNLMNAMLDCNRALSMKPDFFPAKLVRAQCYFGGKKYDEAINDFEEFIKKSDEGFPEASLKQNELHAQHLNQKAALLSQVSKCYAMKHSKLKPKTSTFTLETLSIPDRHHSQNEIKDMYISLIKGIELLNEKNLTNAFEMLVKARECNPNEPGIVDGLYCIKKLLEMNLIN